MARKIIRRNRRLVKWLSDNQKIDLKDLESVKAEQSSSDKHLDELLIERNLITEDDLTSYYRDVVNVQYVDLNAMSKDDFEKSLFDKDVATEYTALPISVKNNYAVIALPDPTDLIVIETLGSIVGKRIIPKCAEISLLKKSIDDLYESASKPVTNDFDSDMSAVDKVNTILRNAVHKKASDIHIEPFEHRVVIRYRIDGVLLDQMELPKSAFSTLSSRVKITAGMDIAERRKPQDGRIEMTIDDAPFDFRVSSLPTVFGEKIVLRILDRTKGIIPLGKIGFSNENYKLISDLIHTPNGIVLVTGPTGSGKTTTLYSFLSELNSPEKNIITIEDPVEYMLDRVNQVHVNVKAGMTFASGLRSMLRQDPDIIMLGEIRDEETAQIAIRASITGHFVLSTLHTNDAPSTITRLIDMGIQKYLVTDAVKAVIAQRLIRVLCPHCKERIKTDKSAMKLLELDSEEEIYNRVGCTSCNHTGYAGRKALHEVLAVKGKVKTAIEGGGTIEDIRQSAISEGMVSLTQAAVRLVLNGETTIQEMLKVKNV
ncbi:type II/IV secretion system protein [Acidaminobacter sp. JC074]|uniref:GspE/PulE family protein n=1 Tax=Acidaminobacter sp. JC074 TaxID=2530199 RepID=UPI001F10E864|nr:GspE/PulE family protein [Acidaminobacter sp. JC074]MCH4888186.1 type II/IV secretion system protein [Acidaminobacter sp. JC074]